MISTEEFDRYCMLARKHGVSTLKLGAVEITFVKEEQYQPTAPSSESHYTQPTAPTSEDNMLLWSTPFFDDKKGKA